MINVKRIQSSQEYGACKAIRTTVFVDGQGVPADREQDGLDDGCWHYVASENGVALGTVRVRFASFGTVAKIEKMAVVDGQQGKGIGSKILSFVVADLEQSKVSEIKLGAQCHAIPFYEKHGFEAYGDEYMDGGTIPHRWMRKELTKNLATAVA